jgi:hypothetical protein
MAWCTSPTIQFILASGARGYSTTATLRPCDTAPQAKAPYISFVGRLFPITAVDLSQGRRRGVAGEEQVEPFTRLSAIGEAEMPAILLTKARAARSPVVQCALIEDQQFRGAASRRIGAFAKYNLLGLQGPL